MSTQGPDAIVPLSPTEIRDRLNRFAGVDGGINADVVRGRALPSEFFRWDLAPVFVPPPGFGEVVAQALFGV